MNVAFGKAPASSGVRSVWLGARLPGIVAIVFGALTIRSGGQVLFGDPTAREAAGAYVPFVLWFNFLAGFAYVAAGIGLFRRRLWAAWAAIALAGATALVFAALGAHIALGGAFESRTVGAMTLRTLVWSVIAAISFSHLRRWRR